MNFYFKHTIVMAFSATLTLPFWYGRLDWDPEMRLWRAIGDASFILLLLLLVLGPLSRYSRSVVKLLPWRRELGIWFAILAIVHSLLVLDGWVRWDWMRFFGYEFIAQLDRYARIEPGFGLSNLIGIIATFIALPLMITSANWAVKRLGGSSWKWLHYGAYTVFYLVALHSLYFLFMHYTESFHRAVPENLNWFRYPFLIGALVLLTLQMGAFVSTIRRRGRQESRA
ncbi:MAG: ferric reductase-like transmembrane domain-containing protein [Proteobacteria bacterium]|nr:ferric reductase-like transmembrane domain-containing protein [Pseudomonadota bacterium]